MKRANRPWMFFPSNPIISTKMDSGIALKPPLSILKRKHIRYRDTTSESEQLMHMSGKLKPPGAEQYRDESTHKVKIPDFINLVLVVVVGGASWGGDCRACKISRVMGPVHSSGCGIRLGVEILQDVGIWEVQPL